MKITFTHKDISGSALPTYVYKRDEETMPVASFLIMSWDGCRKKVLLAQVCELLCEKGILEAADVVRLAGLSGTEPDFYPEQRDHRLNASALAVANPSPAQHDQ